MTNEKQSNAATSTADATSLDIYSWNVNGLRAVLRKGALKDFLEKKSPDLLCLQEIKSRPDQLSKNDREFLEKDYKIFWNPAERPGYSGTAIFVKKSLLASLSPELLENPIELLAEEGRVEILKTSAFILVNVYTPNSKTDLSRLSLREKDWDPAFKNLLTSLEKEYKLPVLSCGDFNAAHTEIDLARPAQNHHSAGFTDEERQGITNLLKTGFLDTFRSKYPDKIQYSWWSARMRAREKNVGWRIDYFFLNKSSENLMLDAKIYDQILGSDHCPISLSIKI